VYLLIDCGNSSLKFTISNGSYIEEVHSMDYSNLKVFKSNFKSKINHIRLRNLVTYVYIVSVNREIEPLIESILKSLLKGIKVKFLKKRVFKNFKSSYKKINTLGLDRFFNCLGGNYLYPKSNLIIIDMGTATTIDILEKNLSHKGGLILPGALIAHYSLIMNTSMINKKNILLDKKLIGASTSECLSSGFLNGQSEMIKGIVREIKKTSQLKFKVLITGGISNIFIEQFKDYKYHSSLVLNGIINFIKKTN